MRAADRRGSVPLYLTLILELDSYRPAPTAHLTVLYSLFFVPASTPNFFISRYDTMSSRRRLIVFSGGSAANNLIDIFTTLCEDRLGLDFVLPISDNGGSTSEILRVFGGPGIGDVRSECQTPFVGRDNGLWRNLHI